MQRGGGMNLGGRDRVGGEGGGGELERTILSAQLQSQARHPSFLPSTILLQQSQLILKSNHLCEENTLKYK